MRTFRTCGALLALAVTLTAAAAPAQAREGAPQLPPGTYLYAASYFDLGGGLDSPVIDTGSNTVAGTVNTFGRHVEVTPDGKHAYFAQGQKGSPSSKSYLKTVDTESNTVVATDEYTDKALSTFALSADGHRIYAALYDGRAHKSYLQVMDADTHTVLSTDELTGIVAGRPINSMVASPDGSALYLDAPQPGSDNSLVAVYDIAEGTVTSSVALPAVAAFLRLSPDGSRAYAAGYHGLYDIDLAAGALVATVPLDNWASGVAVSQDGSTVYTALSGGGVAVIDAGTDEVRATIPTTSGGGSFSLALSPDGSTLYLADRHRDVITVIDVAGNEVAGEIAVQAGSMISDLAIGVIGE